MIGPEVLPVLARAVSSAVGRAIGSAATTKWNRYRLNTELDKLQNSPNVKASAADIVDSLTLTQANQLAEYLESTRLRLTIERLVCTKFLGRSKREEEQDLLKKQISEAVRLEIDGADSQSSDSLSGLIFDSVTAQIDAYILETELAKYAPHDALAAMAPSAASRVAAGERNAMVLSQISELGAIHAFERDLQRQVLRVHGKLKVPNSNSSKMVALEKLYVAAKLTYADGRTVTTTEALADNQHLVLLGDPGGGKSTLAQKVALDVAGGSHKWGTEVTTIFFVTLREFVTEFKERRLTVPQYLEGLCRSPYNLEPPNGAIEYLLLNGRAHVVLDGLDELIDVSLRARLVEAIHGFIGVYPDVPVTVTSRRIGYEEAPLDGDLFAPVTLGHFDDDAVAQYARNWFALDDTRPEVDRPALADAFLTESQLVSDLRANPLMLALMCGIYSAEGYIPHNRPDVYEKCAVMLFEKWDRQRSIIVNLPFDAHVRSAMYALADWVYKSDDSQQGIDRNRIVGFIRDYLHGRRFESVEDAENAADRFISFCTGRAWVLTDVGSDPEQPQYGFTHRTFLEYFAAKQIVRDHPSAQSLFEHLAPQIERAESDVVGQIAVQLLGQSVSDGSDDFLDLLTEWADAHIRSDEEAINLTSFSCRLLSFIVPRPATVRQVTRQAFKVFEAEQEVNPRRLPVSPMYDLVAASTENLPIISNELGLLLSRAYTSDQRPPDHVLAIAAFPAAFAKASSQTIASQAALSHWNAVTEQYRVELDAYLARNRRISNGWSWTDSYTLARSFASTLPASSINQRELFDRDVPESVEHECLVSGLLHHLAGKFPAGSRDEFRTDSVIPNSIALDLTASILACSRPWKTISDSDRREVYDPADCARSELFSSVEVNGLYAVLAAIQTDITLAARVTIESRRQYWSRVTGGIFDGIGLTSMPVGASVRGFLQRWLTEGYGTVSK